MILVALDLETFIMIFYITAIHKQWRIYQFQESISVTYKKLENQVRNQRTNDATQSTNRATKSNVIYKIVN